MTINGIGSATSLNTMQTGSTQRAGKGPFEAVSSVLGMSADAIAQEVKSGKSLMDLATEKGVSSDDLISALKDGAPEELKNSDDLDQVVQQIAEQKGLPAGPDGAHGPGGHGGPPPGPPPAGGVLGGGQLTDSQQNTLEALSDLLDMSSDELTEALQSGTSLTDLFTQKGVDLDDLSSSAEKGVVVDVRA